MWTLVDNEDIKVGDRVRFLGARVEYTVIVRHMDTVLFQATGLASSSSYDIQEEDRFERWEEPVQAVGAWKECKPEDMIPGDKIRVVGQIGSETVFERMYSGMVVVAKTKKYRGNMWSATIQTFERWEEPVQASTEWVECDLSTLSPGSPIVRTNDPATLENNPTVLEFVEYYPDLKIAEVRDPINGYTSAYYDNEQFTFYTRRPVREPSPPAPKVIDDYPHTCYHCGSPAYVGEYGIDCKGKCEASK
jgi:hypothetical protein